jgi:hypothetical protein
VEIMVDKTCTQCGAPLGREDIFCPFCGQTQRAFFENVERVEYCKQFLLENETLLNDLPPAPGWKLLLLWFGLPLIVWCGVGLFFQSITGWLGGAAAAVVCFLLLTPLVANQRDQIRQRQFETVVHPRLVVFCRDESVALEDLMILARHDEKLQKSGLLKFLKKLPAQDDREIFQ